MVNYHHHIQGCMNNESLRRVCLACKFDAWQAAVRKPRVMGKTFEQLLTGQDAKLLRAMLISWEEDNGTIPRATHHSASEKRP
jgi:hypothetical protein